MQKTTQHYTKLVVKDVALHELPDGSVHLVPVSVFCASVDVRILDAYFPTRKP